MTEWKTRAIDLARSGVPPREIGATLGIAPHTVREAFRRARNNGIDVPKFARGRPLGPFAKDRSRWPLEALELEAEARGITASELAARILRTVAADGLFEAILDG